VSGVQHVVWSAAEQSSPDGQLFAQLRGSPVHGSVPSEPQKFAGQVWGVQHMFVSPPETPHCSPDGQLFEQSNTFPLQGSVYWPAHWFAGHPVAAVQHVWSLPMEQICPLGQLFGQLNVWPLHGSVY
jgi:hypothetical protein